MKRFVSALAVLFISAGVFAQTGSSTTQATPTKKADDFIKFKETVHNFGKIKQGVPVTFDFAFDNISDKAVVIEFAQASCGCTTPVKPEAPIAKGKSDKITAGFNAQGIGPFNKTITVKVAGVDTPVDIKITGEVLTADDYAKYQTDQQAKKS